MVYDSLLKSTVEGEQDEGIPRMECDTKNPRVRDGNGKLWRVEGLGLRVEY